jgi:hypothetical protein
MVHVFYRYLIIAHKQINVSLPEISPRIPIILLLLPMVFIQIPGEDNMFSYAYLVPGIHQSGNREWKDI